MPRTLLLFALLSGLLVLGLSCEKPDDWPTVKQKIRGKYPGVEQVSTGELAAWLASEEAPPPLLLDVREEEEFRVSHLRGAVRVDPGEAEPALPEWVEKDTPIVAYCSVGYRSSRLAQRLKEQGYERVASLEGSIFEWANEGYPVVRGGEEVRQVHPYDERWGRLLERQLHAFAPR